MRIEGTRFGEIAIDGATYDYDVIIRLSGKVEKRRKRLSKTKAVVEGEVRDFPHYFRGGGAFRVR